MGSIFVLAAVTLIAHLPHAAGGFIWDDNYHLTENLWMRSPDGLRAIWLQPGATPQYYPLVFTTYWLGFRIWGLDPFGYHLLNIVLHVVNTLLIWQLLRRLEVRGAWLAAAIFGIHPVHVESVAWITELRNVLYTMFYLLSLVCYLRFHALKEIGSRASSTWGAYGSSLILFLCGLLTKSTTCTLPVIVLLILWWMQKLRRTAHVYPLIPFFLSGLLMGFVTIWVERVFLGTQGADWSFSFLERLLIAGRSLCFYLSKLLWPANLAFIYPKWHVDPSQWWQYLFPAAVIGLVVGAWAARHKLGKGPLAAILFFILTIAPALGFINFYGTRFAFVTDHHQYVPSIGVIALGASMITSFSFTPARKYVTAGVILLLWITLTRLTWQRSYIFQDAVRLYEDTISKNPTSWLAYHNLAHELTKQGEHEKALHCQLEALRIKPDLVKTRVNMAYTLRTLGKRSEAKQEYERALTLESD
ncbi:MAG: hypothetical protein A3G87_05760, partial [Omnitrophica bacterium RIFCSPLOWO2_12_FULL_50_11]